MLPAVRFDVGVDPLTMVGSVLLPAALFVGVVEVDAPAMSIQNLLAALPTQLLCVLQCDKIIKQKSQNFHLLNLLQ